MGRCRISISPMTSRPTVLLTDYAWPDNAIEAELLEDAGFHLIAGPAEAASADAITALAAEHQPAAIMTNSAPVSAARSRPRRRCASSRAWVSGSTTLPSMRLPDAASGSRMCRTTPSRRCRTTPSPCCWLVRADSLTTSGGESGTLGSGGREAAARARSDLRHHRVARPGGGPPRSCGALVCACSLIPGGRSPMRAVLK